MYNINLMGKAMLPHVVCHAITALHWFFKLTTNMECLKTNVFSLKRKRSKVNASTNRMLQQDFIVLCKITCMHVIYYDYDNRILLMTRTLFALHPIFYVLLTLSVTMKVDHPESSLMFVKLLL